MKITAARIQLLVLLIGIAMIPLAFLSHHYGWDVLAGVLCFNAGQFVETYREMRRKLRADQLRVAISTAR